METFLFLLELAGTVAFAVSGAVLGIEKHMDIFGVGLLGITTAVGGGILRDICMNREPEAFQAGALYGSAALIGSIAYALMAQNHILDQYAALTCAVLVLGLRYASLFFGWRTSPPRDYSDVVTSAVAKPVKSVARRVRPPKGKVERDKERRGYEKLRAFWARMNGEVVPKRNAKSGRELEVPDGRTAPSDASVEHAADPSDRIIVDREELRRIMGGEDDEPRDPFEPRS